MKSHKFQSLMKRK